MSKVHVPEGLKGIFKKRGVDWTPAERKVVENWLFAKQAYRHLLIFALWHLGSATPEDAQDTVHDFYLDKWDGLVRLYEPTQEPRSDQPFWGYVKKSLKNFCYDRIRIKEREKQFTEQGPKEQEGGEDERYGPGLTQTGKHVRIVPKNAALRDPDVPLTDEEKELRKLEDDRQAKRAKEWISSDMVQQFLEKEFRTLEGELEKRQSRRQLLECIYRLEPIYRDAVVLTYFGESQETIEKVLCISRANVRTRLHRAIPELRKLVEAEGIEP